MTVRLALIAITIAILATGRSAASADALGAVVVVKPAGEATLLTASVDIAAPPAVVWAVVSDCAYARRMMEKLKTCRVLERDPQGRWDVREQIIQPLILPRVRTVVRNDYDAPKGVVFRQIAGDLRAQEGTWRLEPLDDGRTTHAVYESRIVLGFPVPGAFFREALRSEVEKGLTRLQAICREQNAPGGMQAVEGPDRLAKNGVSF